jgi:uncharacterized repeat protein (TIGR03803 family)
MYSSETNGGTKRHLNTSDLAARSVSTKLAAAVTHVALNLAVLSALLLIAARPAHAQTETVLYRFHKDGLDGKKPQSRLTSDGKGNLYGTTAYGGAFGYGTVFELSPNGGYGHRLWKETALYSFTGGTDGAWPLYSPVVFDSLGNLYGTTNGGGAFGVGTVFELSPAGTSWTETVVHSFSGGTDSSDPENGLIIDPAGNLYGTTFFGGADFFGGTVFELSPSGGGWTWQVIYSVDHADHGGIMAGLTMDAAGNIFGVGNMSVFELSPDGNGGWNPTVIYTFKVFRYPGIYQFGEFTPALDNAGNLYVPIAFATNGGSKDCCGVVYKLSPGVNGTWTAKPIYFFKGANGGGDGSGLTAGVVVDAAGKIYGTTFGGGAYREGTVFALVPRVDGVSYKEKILYSFHGPYGSSPYGSLILDSAGNLYGTTTLGGNGTGAVFKLTP